MRTSHRSAHPPDEVLLAWAVGLETEAATGAHVQRCPQCAARVTDWQGQRDSLQDLLQAVPDASVNDAALVRQRESVMRRLRGEARARVIPFPAVQAALRHEHGPLGATTRWVAAAAVVGLLVGGSAVRMLDPHLRAPASPARTVAVDAPHARPAVWQNASDPGADEAFLVELDAALVSRGAEPLRALDALTPERDPSLRPR